MIDTVNVLLNVEQIKNIADNLPEGDLKTYLDTKVDEILKNKKESQALWDYLPVSVKNLVKELDHGAIAYVKQTNNTFATWLLENRAYKRKIVDQTFNTLVKNKLIEKDESYKNDEYGDNDYIVYFTPSIFKLTRKARNMLELAKRKNNKNKN